MFLLLVFGGSVTDLGVGVRSAVAAPLCSFCRFLRWILKKDGGLKQCTRRSFDEAGSNVLVNRQDQFKLIQLKLLELIATYNALTVVKLEMGGVPSVRNHPSLQRLQAVGAIPKCFGYSERSCPLG